MKSRKTISMLLILLLALGMVGTTFADRGQDFKDLESNHWAYGAVKKMVNLGVLEGFNDGSFKPDDAVTREQFAKMMVASLRLELQKPSTASFEDVSKQYWAYAYIETAKPYLTGYQSGESLKFKPTENAVREDMAVALVKALGYGNGAVDEGILDRFADADSISKNIRKYAGIAVSKNLMSGSKSGSGLLFKPQSTLTRAEAAVLLANVINEEKIVFGDETKVVMDPATPPAATSAVVVKGAVENGKMILRWDHNGKDGLQGFKVVASLNNPTPKYPDDGYLFWITNLDARSKTFDASSGYNGGDFGGTLKPGTTYYFSVTAVYDKQKIAGNAVRLTVPGTVDEEVPAGQATTISGKASGDEVDLRWNRISHPKFQGYKVVISSTNPNPGYPDDGYYTYITDSSDTEVSVEAGDVFNNGKTSETLKSGKAYYFSITTLYSDRKVPGNTIRITLP